MADRFYSEGSKNNGAAGSNIGSGSPKPQNTNPYSRTQAKGLGDFSENIDSNIVRPGQGTASPQKKFEVHINDFDDFLSMPDEPSKPAPAANPVSKAPASPVKKEPAPVRRAPVQRPAQSAKTAAPARKIPVSGAKSSPVKKMTGLTAMAKKPAAKAPVSRGTAPTGSATPSAPMQRKSADKKSTTAKRQYTPEQQQRIKARKRYNFTKGLLAACVCIFFIAIMVVTATTIAMETINDILVIDKSDNVTANITVNQGDEFIDVFNKLEQEGLIRQKTLCYVFLMYREYQTMQYQPGVYYLESKDGIEYNIETMMVRRSGSKDTVRLTFPEGWSVAQIFEKIEKYGVCSADKLYANLCLPAVLLVFTSGGFAYTRRE